VRPAGFESSKGGFRLAPQPAAWLSSCPKHKKAGNGFFITTTSYYVLVRPAGFESSKGGFRLAPQPAAWLSSCPKHKSLVMVV
jgi:hypothetical protein